jgi:hypothetical protein
MIDLDHTGTLIGDPLEIDLIDNAFILEFAEIFYFFDLPGIDMIAHFVH